MADTLLDTIVKGWRADPQGKPETLPTKFNRRDVINIASGLNRAQELGMPEIGSKQLLNKILLEGRADAGVNEYNVNNPKAVELAKQLSAEGYPDISARYAAAVLDKMQTAQRLNIPFEQAWNGAGKSQETKRTGKQHSDRAAASQGASDFEKNSELRDLIARTSIGDLSTAENVLKMSSDELVSALLGIDKNKLVSWENGNPIYTNTAMTALSDRLAFARREVEKETGAKRGSVMNPYYSEDSAQVLAAMESAYRIAAGTKPYYTWGDRLVDNPVVQRAIGIKQQAPNQPVVQEQGILDKILSFFK